MLSILIIKDNGELAGQCNSNVGTIKGISNFIGNSNRRSLGDTIFLCWNDRFYIDHNDDYNLSGDPDPLTAPGIGYGWYKGKPVIAGNTKSDISNDPIWRFTGDPNHMITVQNLNGDAIFENYFYSGFKSFNQAVNPPGNPTLVHYAPITVDNRIGSRGFHENGGPCVKASPNESFPVVYLNPIKISDIQYNVDGDPLKISFVVNGGAPEYYFYRYGLKKDYESIEINDSYFLSNKIKVPGTGISHGDRVTVLLKEFSEYNVVITDKFACSETGQIKVSRGVNPSFIIDTISAKEGELMCFTFKVRDFENLEYITGRIDYDPTVIEFHSLQTIFPDTYKITVESPGVLIFTYEDINSPTLPDDTELFWLCFKAIGKIGECSPVNLTYFQAVNTDLDDIYPYVENGLFCIDAPDGLYISTTYCGSDNIFKPESSLTFKIYNGTGPYTYEVKDQGGVVIESGTVNETLVETTVFGLYAGRSYTITVTDKNGIVFTTPNKPIGTVPPLEFESIEIKNPTCYGFDDGRISISVKDGQFFQHSIRWSTNVFGMDTLENLVNGTYGVTIVDKASGCKTDTFVTLFVPKLNLEWEKLSDASCKGINDAQVLARISGGTPDPATGYTFRWQQGSNTFPITDFTQSLYNLAGEGKLLLKVNDKYAYCSVTDTISIGTKYTMVVSDSTVLDPTCSDSKNGSITLISDLIGHPDPKYNLKFPIFPSYPFNKIGNDQFIIDNLDGGRYIVILEETTTGCQVRDTFNLTEPPPMIVNKVVSQVGCDETQLAYAEITINGGQKPIKLSGIGPTQTIPINGLTYTYRDLNVGNYTVYLEDANGCLDTLSFDVTRWADLVKIDSFKFAPLACVPDAKTDIYVYGSSGNGQIIYRWTDMLGIYLGNTNVLMGVGSGSYIIELKDSKCTIRDTIVIPQAKPFSYTEIVTPAECGVGETGGLKGGACINIAGGDTGFTYTWSNGMTGKCINNLQAGVYFVSISDNGGCTVKDTINIPGGPVINIDILALKGISCNDGSTSDGSIAINASGGNNPLNVYTFRINNGPSKVGKIISFDNLTGGENILTVSYNTINGNVCTKTDTISVPVPEKLTLDKINSKVIMPTCFGDCNGSAIIKATGGNNAKYFYKWQETGQDGAVVSGLCAGKYHIEITDANLCTVIDSIEITQPSELVVKIDSAKTKNISCSGSNTGEIHISFTGGNPNGPYTFKWNPDVSNSTSAGNLSKGVYTVTVTDYKGCNDFVSYEIKEQEPISFTPVQAGDIKCYGDQTCITVRNVQGGSGKLYTFSINGGAIFPVDSCRKVYASQLPYLISVFDSEGCKADRELLVTQPAQIEVDLGDKLVVDLGDKETVSVSTNAIIDSISWKINKAYTTYKYLNTDKSEIEIESYADNIIYATVTDVNGCKSTGELQITVNTLRNVDVPNIFSPDGDGRNDIWKIKTGKGVDKVNYIMIFDRWGEKMYVQENISPSGGYAGSWDGTYSGTKLNPGVYVYLVEVNFIDNRKILYRGSITLLR
ncbi:MAG: gliding motility-associated C-terminal domain-containing protein [Saprospiraceae bacterium]|nr:gliding motility-associated C-terminal domain-containing protein [Saprospiraceae bacterium]